MCEVMKTKSTYWSVIRSLVATIVAVMGFAMVSVGQVSLKNGYNTSEVCSGIEDSWPCGSDAMVYKVTANWQAIAPYNGATQILEYEGAGNYCNNGTTSPCQLKQGTVYIKVSPSKVELVGEKPNCGPSVPNIAGGVSSICLNDAEKNIVGELWNAQYSNSNFSRVDCFRGGYTNRHIFSYNLCKHS